MSHVMVITVAVFMMCFRQPSVQCHHRLIASWWTVVSRHCQSAWKLTWPVVSPLHGGWKQIHGLQRLFTQVSGSWTQHENDTNKKTA